MNKELIRRGATISACGSYRYHLWREWEPARPRMLLIMLNPAGADQDKDDHTITRSIAIAWRLGCGRLDVGNLAAWRSPHPSDLKLAADPVGPSNDYYLRQMLRATDLLVCAWGASAVVLPGRLEAVAKLIRKSGRPAYALKLTAAGFPSHPLARGKGFIPIDAALVPFPLG